MRKDFSAHRRKGSVLILSIMMIFLMLAASLTLLSATNLQQTSAFSTSTSARSIQTADAAVEQALYQIYKVKDNAPVVNLPTLNALVAAVNPTATCSLGVASTPDWKVAFYDGSGALMNCASATWRDNLATTGLARIRAQGVVNGTVRSLEVSVKGPTVLLP